MNPSLALIVWFFTVLIIFFVFWWLAGYNGWESIAMATLISFIVLIILFPWNFEHHHSDKDNHHHGRTAFYIIALVSIIILIAYIISTYIYVPSQVVVATVIPVVSTVQI